MGRARQIVSGPKRAPGRYRQPRGWKGNTYVDPYLALPLIFFVGLYLVLKYEAGWQWMDRVAAALWMQIKPLFE